MEEGLTLRSDREAQHETDFGRPHSPARLLSVAQSRWSRRRDPFLADRRARRVGGNRDGICSSFPGSDPVGASSEADGRGAGDRNGMRGGDNACVETSTAVCFAVFQTHPTPAQSSFTIFAAIHLSTSHVKRVRLPRLVLALAEADIGDRLTIAVADDECLLDLGDGPGRPHGRTEKFGRRK